MPKGVYKRNPEMKTGKHMLGRKLSLETIQKLKIVNKGEGNGFYGKTHTPEVIEKIRLAHLGKKLNEEHKKKIGIASKGHIGSWRGKKMPQEMRDKMSVSAKKVIHTPEWNKKISITNKGKIISPETRLKLSIANLGKKHPASFSEKMKGKFSGSKNPFFGKHHTKETIEKIRLTHLGKPSKKWKGGYENKLWHNRQRRVKKLTNGGSHTLGEWEHIKALYQWTCPACWRKEPMIKLTVDHIIPLSKNGTDNIENIQPLCKSCNCRKHDKIINYKK